MTSISYPQNHNPTPSSPPLNRDSAGPKIEKLANDTTKSVHKRITLIQEIYRALIKDPSISPNFKTQMCDFVLKNQCCKYGNKCQFAHSHITRAATYAIFAQTRGNMNAFKAKCRAELSEFCPKAPHCIFSHVGEPIFKNNKWGIAQPSPDLNRRVAEEAEWNEPPGEFAAWGPRKRTPEAQGAPLLFRNKPLLLDTNRISKTFLMPELVFKAIQSCIYTQAATKTLVATNPPVIIETPVVIKTPVIINTPIIIETPVVIKASAKDSQKFLALLTSSTVDTYLKFHENHIPLSAQEKRDYPALDYLSRLEGNMSSDEHQKLLRERTRDKQKNQIEYEIIPVSR